jgi:hypothetical protein
MRLPLFFVFFPVLAGAVEFTEGSVKLALHNETGRFSLYALNSRGRYEALFVDKDPRTSFLSLMVNGTTYKLGDSSAFRTTFSADPSKPALVFESPFLLVTQEFSFIKTAGAGETNGVAVKITMENRGAQKSLVGARFLLDTDLGETGSGAPFTTDTRSISSEIVLERGSADKWWISRNEERSLMGSMFTGGAPGERPDSLYFANWKRLNDVSWKIAYQQGRNFNLPPYSVGDSAVCYYFEPRSLEPGESCSFTVLLAAATEATEATEANKATEGGLINAGAGESSGPVGETDLEIIRRLIVQIDGYISAGTVTEEVISAMEAALNQVMERNGLKTNSASR